MSSNENYRKNFMAAALMLSVIEEKSKADPVSFRKLFPNGEENLASLKAELAYMFDVLRQHEALEAEALKG